MRNLKKHIKTTIALVRGSNPILVLSFEIAVGICLTFFSLLLFLHIREEVVVEKEFSHFDMGILHYFYSLRTPLINEIMMFITNLGGFFMIYIWIGLICVLLAKKHIRQTVLLGFVLSMAGVINVLIKLVIQRPRPFFHPLVIENDYSFPSGHAMNSFVFYITLAYLVYRFTKNKKLTLFAVTIALLLIFLIGISRVYLGVHYPSDVIAGYIAGMCWFVSVLLIQKTLVFFRLFKEAKLSRKEFRE